MLSDIKIAQQAKMEPVTKIASKLGITEDEIEMYGKYKAKLSFDLIDRVKDNEDVSSVHTLIFLVHHADARGGSQRSGYRREYRNDEVDDFLPKFFLVHSRGIV